MADDATSGGDRGQAAGAGSVGGKPPRKRLKWEPVAAMVALLLLGVWVAFAPDVPQKQPEGAQRVKLSAGPIKGVLEWMPAPPGGQSSASGASAGDGSNANAVSGASGGLAATGETFRVLYRDGTEVGPLSRQQVQAVFGEAAVNQITRTESNFLFRVLNMTGWAGLIWVLLGFGGQLAFSGRWLLQWFVSEKSRSSTVPVSFWWMSMIGSVMLFVYFVWRNDIVGVLGQTSGVVIYARNIRLISKQRRREARAAAKQSEEEQPDLLPPGASN
jgi:lipid-A-disaccharide synthase-like uncharacterized protein